MSKQYEPSLAVTSLAGKLSKAMADCLREADQCASDNLEAALLCTAIMAKTSKLSKTSDELAGMAAAVAQLRELTAQGPVEVDSGPSPLLMPNGKPVHFEKSGAEKIADGTHVLGSIDGDPVVLPK